jgi:hypothetical protein
MHAFGEGREEREGELEGNQPGILFGPHLLG